MKPTHWILIGTTLAFVLFDVFMASNKPAGDTFSEVILRYAINHPVIPFAFGVLAGHLMWPQFLGK